MTHSALHTIEAALRAWDAAATNGAPRWIVTAGPTCEDLDAVRFLTNRSTGRMGWSLAEAARDRGAAVLLVHGPVHLDTLAGVTPLPVRAAREMHAAVLAAFPRCEALLMAAAVADYTPAETQPGKMKKTEGELLLRLARTPDILAAVAAHPARAEKTVVGFSLEADMDEAEARRKLARKKLDAIVLNTTAAFGGEETRPRLLRADGTVLDPGETTKTDLAALLVDEVCRLRPRR